MPGEQTTTDQPEWQAAVKDLRRNTHELADVAIRVPRRVAWAMGLGAVVIIVLCAAMAGTALSISETSSDEKTDAVSQRVDAIRSASVVVLNGWYQEDMRQIRARNLGPGPQIPPNPSPDDLRRAVAAGDALLLTADLLDSRGTPVPGDTAARGGTVGDNSTTSGAVIAPIPGTTGLGAGGQLGGGTSSGGGTAPRPGVQAPSGTSSGATSSGATGGGSSGGGSSSGGSTSGGTTSGGGTSSGGSSGGSTPRGGLLSPLLPPISIGLGVKLQV